MAQKPIGPPISVPGGGLPPVKAVGPLPENPITGTSSSSAGVSGQSNAGPGVWGISLPAPEVAGSGKSDGVYGTSQWGVGVHGTCAGGTAGVWGDSSSTGTGVKGTSSRGFGVWASGSPAGHFEGNLEVTGNLTMTGAGSDILLSGGDCAEDFDVAGSSIEIESGTVVIINQGGALQQSEAAYDKRVAGVISGAGDLKPGIVLDKQQSQTMRMPVALVGKVYCKVDAQHSPIEVGDLLTTSSTPGHAMKADDPVRAFGAVIGKALGRLSAGQGLIPILVALQ